MNCPRCGAKIPKDVTQCPFCGQHIHPARRHISFGKISITCAFSGIILLIVILTLFRLLNSRAFDISQFLANIIFVLSVLSIAFGSIAFFGKTRDVLGLIGIFLGICLLAVIIIGLSLIGLIFFKSGVSLILPL
jgi:hypothetical protein